METPELAKATLGKSGRILITDNYETAMRAASFPCKSGRPIPLTDDTRGVAHFALIEAACEYNKAVHGAFPLFLATVVKRRVIEAHRAKRFKFRDVARFMSGEERSIPDRRQGEPRIDREESFAHMVNWAGSEQGRRLIFALFRDGMTAREYAVVVGKSNTWAGVMRKQALGEIRDFIGRNRADITTQGRRMDRVQA